MVLTIYAIVLLLLWLGAGCYVVVNSRRIYYLKDIPPAATGSPPSVVIIIAVKNEEVHIEEALRSVCRLSYAALRVIVVEDRSTDSTGQILERMVRENPLLQVINIKELPPGWLGKNHALFTGYRSSDEEWLLFTDADVSFAPKALQKALSYAQNKRLDHLTVLPEITSRSLLFRAVMNSFALFLTLRLRPWNASVPRSKASIGVGAFNLVKRTAYEKAGTHQAISLRPDDDLKLGERIKLAGLRQDVLYGDAEIWLEWYSSLGQFISGLMKNTFSVSNYNLAFALVQALTAFFVLVLPLPLFLLSGYPFWLMSVAILLIQVLVVMRAKGIKSRWWHGLLMSFAGSIMVYIIIRSALHTIRLGGIYWRGSFYSLQELKKQT